MEAKSKRVINVEILRLIGCIIVIGQHIKLPFINDNNIDIGRLSIASLFADNVAIFFMITGFFWFNGKSYKKIVKNTITKILVPALLLIAFSQIFLDWLTNTKTFLYCLQNPKIDFNLVLSNLFNWKTNIPACIHLWYICSYLKCVLWYPILNIISKDEKETIFARKIMLVWVVLEIIVMVIQNFYTLPFGKISFFTSVDKGIFWIMIGKEIYKKIDKIKENKKIRIIGAFMVVFGNIIRIIAQYFACKFDITNQVFFSWGYGFTYITAIGLALFILSFDFKPNKINNCLLFLASKTYYIYLVHWAVMEKLKNVSQNIFNILGNNRMNFLGENLYTIINILMVFVVSLIVSVIIEMVWKLIKNIFFKIQKIIIKDKSLNEGC